MNVMDSENNVAASQQGIITVENVTAGYKDKIVWSNANFSINRGEFVAVIGPNGAEKPPYFDYFSAYNDLSKALFQF